MTFNSVMNSIRNGQAACTGSMLGYFKREDVPEVPAESRETKRSAVEAGEDYTVDSAKSGTWYTFVENRDVDPYAPASSDSVRDYVFTVVRYTRSTYTRGSGDMSSDTVVAEDVPVEERTLPNLGTTPSVEKPLVMDWQLLEAFASNDWSVTDLATAENRRAGAAVSRW